jgi:hypothetical protein
MRRLRSAVKLPRLSTPRTKKGLFVRLNSATGYITPKDMLAGRQQEIQAERDRKLEVARKQRQIRRQQAA